MSSTFKDKKRIQLVFFFILSSVLTNALDQIKQTSAAVSGSGGSQSSSSSEATSSSQPLWSYQVKPNTGGYLNVPNAANHQQYQSNLGHHYPGSFSASLFEAFSGLSQRQGALSGSPFLSILPIILIAAGGMLLLLPFLTMMIASPFSGGAFGGGAFNGGGNFGYPQQFAAAGLNKKRSLNGAGDPFSQRSLVDLMESVSTTIEELARKYSSTSSTTMGGNKRAGKNLFSNNSQQSAPASPTATTETAGVQLESSNHKSLINSGSDDSNHLSPNGLTL